MEIKASERMQNIAPSATLAITANARQLDSEKREIVNFAAGEPDFDTPDNIKNAAIDSIKKGFTKYTPSSGTVELKNAIIEKYKKDYGLEYSQKQVIVSCGAKHSLYNVFISVLNHGDEVILPSPYWLSYIEQIKLADALPVLVDTSETDFKLTPRDFSESITSKTKMLIINSPNNPTGAVYTEQELKEIVSIAVNNKILIISDEIYDAYLYDDRKHVCVATLSEKAKHNTFIVNGLSKSYSMTGWRIGYTLGNEEIIGAATRLQDHSTSNPVSISQKAALEALEGMTDDLKKTLKTFETRRDIMVYGLKETGLLKIEKPEGSFYCFPSIEKCFGMELYGKRINGSLDMTEVLLEDAGVAVIPGKPFGSDYHIRLSFTTDEKSIKKGVAKINDTLRKLK